ncbi:MULTISPECIES: glycoside hydrolase family 13 protein [Nocardiopsis]|uniref:Alpha-glucosidase n=1 Tax=Nocardiopsis changdeensis TaxID=2831969 RepID=A0ABX8BWG6_9ACTN|nr:MULTISPECIES: alpha-glucosidase [Nocardiopsis]QUX24683.1 alpha-glucosidase [Nocardiopsis changdeensis]QYX35071.1 alpha-glucosidase [Nocardiopsis sp. MT53]
MPQTPADPWWKSAVVYQIYPSSFQDADGDGLGDLPGVIDRLDYLHTLGVDVVWLSPVYPSPLADNGYDISDYLGIHPRFGTLADWDRLRDGLHERGMRLVMDLVVNHTSDEHPWFADSRASRDSPYRDFYFWRPGRGDGPPNNWGSVFSGPAWTRDDATGEYFLHLFTRNQPDLNWENPKVREQVHDIARWWLDRGADGFRMDVVNFVSKAPGLPDGPVPPGSGYGLFAEYSINGPRLHEFLGELRDAAFAGRDVLTVGEMPGVSVEQARAHTDPVDGEVSMVFQFEHVDLDHGPGGKFDRVPLDLRRLKGSLDRWQLGLADRGWNSLYLNNHDQPRAVSRFGDDGEHRTASAKTLATTLHMMKGTPYVYQGEELGMANAGFSDISEYRDVETHNHYLHAMAAGADEARVMAGIARMSRDNARTPMQWDASPNAGFTTGTPWIAVNPDHTEVNAEAALADPDSVFHHYRRLIALRKEHPVVVHGAYTPLLPEHPALYAYTRTLDGTVLTVLANWSADTVAVDAAPAVAGPRPELLLGTHPAAEEGVFAPLRPWESRVLLSR